MPDFRAFALALGAVLLAGAAPAAELRAEQITRENAAELQVGGLDAIGGVGDWALGNGRLCAVISDARHETALSEHGGALVDLGHCGSADDQLSVLQEMLGLGRGNVAPVERIRAEVAGDEARVVVESGRGGIRAEHAYVLSRSEPEVLRVRSVLTRTAEGERLPALGSVVLHPSGSLKVFAAVTRDPERSPGFRYPEVDGERMLTVVRSFTAADLHVLVGEDALEPGIAYGIQLVSAQLESKGAARSVPFAATTGEDFTMLAVLARPPWLGSSASLGLLQLAQMPLMDLGPGERLRVERVVHVGDRADVACITDRIFAAAPRVLGRVDDPAARVHVETPSGAPVTEVRPGPDGSFAFRIPEGSYRLRVLAPGGRSLVQDVAVGGGGADLGTLQVGAAARVALPRGAGPMRLVFRGVDGTPDPRLGDDLLGATFGELEGRGALRGTDVSLGGLPGDPEEVVLAPGRYRVLATRGPEHSVTERALEVLPGARIALEIEPPARVLETPGWIAADLHVHSGASFDSSLPLETRVRSFLAQGAEVLVSTEHNQIVDLAPLLHRLGVGDELRSVVGLEITSTAHSEATPRTAGHANAFPIEADPLAHRGGALPANGRRLRAAIASVRALGGARVVQLNHPRHGSGRMRDENLFSHLSSGEPYDPTRELSEAPNRRLLELDPDSGARDLDFDAIELLNGLSLDAYRLVRADWLSLWLQGEGRTGTANSDSHRLGQIVAAPRNYVRIPDDRPAALDLAAFVDAVREGRVQGTTGPFLEVSLDGTELGGRHRRNVGVLRIAVRAAPWVPVSTARVLVNAVVVAEAPIQPGVPLEIPLRFERDSLVTVEVEGEPGSVYTAVNPGFRPFAFTNPILVDADTDGAWTPPGWPDPLPPALAAPLSLPPREAE